MHGARRGRLTAVVGRGNWQVPGAVWDTGVQCWLGGSLAEDAAPRRRWNRWIAEHSPPWLRNAARQHFHVVCYWWCHSLPLQLCTAGLHASVDGCKRSSDAQTLLRRAQMNELGACRRQPTCWLLATQALSECLRARSPSEVSVVDRHRYKPRRDAAPGGPAARVPSPPQACARAPAALASRG
jgi:hypothetical protein